MTAWGGKIPISSCGNSARVRALDAAPAPMVYGILMGVRRDAPQLNEKIERALAQEKPRIAALLRAYGVPQTAARAFAAERAPASATATP